MLGLVGLVQLGCWEEVQDRQRVRQRCYYSVLWLRVRQRVLTACYGCVVSCVFDSVFDSVVLTLCVCVLHSFKS